ncbi:MAG TPA: hypothetical protein VIS99_17585, partial [Terrimicrobiaceae bacterium]
PIPAIPAYRVYRKARDRQMRAAISNTRAGRKRKWRLQQHRSQELRFLADYQGSGATQARFAALREVDRLGNWGSKV